MKWMHGLPSSLPINPYLHHVVDRVEAARARMVGEHAEQRTKGLVPPQVVRVARPPPVGPQRVPEEALRHEHLGGALCCCFDEGCACAC